MREYALNFIKITLHQNHVSGCAFGNGFIKILADNIFNLALFSVDAYHWGKSHVLMHVFTVFICLLEKGLRSNAHRNLAPDLLVRCVSFF